LPFERIKPSDLSVTNVGINISGLLFNGGYNGNNLFKLKTDYPALARSLIAAFMTIPGCVVHLISHVISNSQYMEDDYRVAAALAKEFPGTIHAPRFATPSEAKGYISSLDFFTGSRMHACIAAFSSGVPVVPIAYSRKFSGLFGSLAYTQVADCKTQSNAEVITKVLAGFANRAQLRTEVERGRKIAFARIMSYENVLKAAINVAAGKQPK
jgi:colanic acid/amylovoran biosynthesis protein